MNNRRTVLVNADADASLVEAVEVKADIETDRQQLYFSVEEGIFDYGVVVIQDLASISCAFALLNYLMEGKIKALCLVGLQVPLDINLGDAWERARLTELLASGSIVQVPSVDNPITLASISYLFRTFSE